MKSVSPIKLYFFIIISTALLYLWQLHLYPMINPDGVTYIEAALAYVKDGLKSVVYFEDQAKWPFYSILLAWFYNLTGFEIYTAQQTLDGLFILSSACLFLYSVRLFSPHPWAGFWAIVTWLTWHSYVKWWPLCIRDHGFIAIFLLSFCFYYHFVNTKKTLWALAWGFSLLLAELFRIEAVIFLIFLPFSLFFLKKEAFSSRFLLWLKANIITVCLAILVFILFANHIFTLNSFRFAYMWQELSLYFSTTHTEMSARYDIMKQGIFYRENPFPAYALFAGYLTIFICYAIKQSSLVVLLPLFFFKSGLNKLNSILLSPCFFAYFLLSLITPLLFFIEYAFLNGRYLIPFGLFVSLFVSSLLPYFIDFLFGKRKIIFIFLLSLLFLLNLMANLIAFGHQAKDDMNAGLWLKANYPEKTIFTDTKRILFYASTSSQNYKHGAAREMWLHGVLGQGGGWLRAHEVWCQYDLLVLSPPLGKTEQSYRFYKQMNKAGVLGPVIYSLKRKDDGEVILVAPIFHEKCFQFVEEFTKKG